ncbi:MAG: electron transport complex subunit RsxC [Lachnospiraceae bacterium]|nr:electron transport complex subunit RsxC [Lachnospiraceae bacterium]
MSESRPRFTFDGGIHPGNRNNKDISKEKPIKDVLPKGDLVYPVSQHIGAPAKPVVNVGDKVKAGQLIAEAGGFVSANIYATVSGTVKAIEKHRVPVGDMVMSIIVENDGLYEEVEYPEAKPLDEIGKDEIIAAVKNAGIVGMGGAGFPTHVKLSPKDPSKIDYVIGNCAECEPYLTSDYRRMMENPELVIGGMKCVLKLFDNAKGIIAIEDNKPDAIELLTKLTKDEPRIDVYALKTKYPQGSERHIIYACTGRAINSKMLPADAGCIVDNCDTLVAIHEAVTKNIPLMYRIVTVTGDAIKDPRNFKVRCGTNYKELIEEAGGFVTEPGCVISGGPMMGFSLFDLDVPVTKTSSALLCMKYDEAANAVESACINCGRCVEACPEKLIPSQLATYSEFEDYEAFNKLYGKECIECGSCSYVCPAKRQLAQSIKSMKKLSIGRDRAMAAAEKAKAEAKAKAEEEAKAKAEEEAKAKEEEKKGGEE